MLVLVVSLLCWTQAKGVCSQAGVRTSGDMELSPGEAFRLTCAFTCLKNNHVAQLWRNNESLVNITSLLPNVTLVLNVSSFTTADIGQYQCRTKPPNTISPPFNIKMADPDNFTRKTFTVSTSKFNWTQQTQQTSSAAGLRDVHAGLQGQLWFWMVLGKTAILLLSLASLAIKYKRG